VRSYAHSTAGRSRCCLDMNVLGAHSKHVRSAPSTAVREDRGDGLRWSRQQHFRNTRTFEETYANGTIDANPSRVIDDFRPDARTYITLTCLSTGIVHLPSTVEFQRSSRFSDYWLCASAVSFSTLDYRVWSWTDDTGACARCLGPAGRRRMRFSSSGRGRVRAVESTARTPATMVRSVLPSTCRGIGLVAAARRRSRRPADRRICTQSVTHRCALQSAVTFGVQGYDRSWRSAWRWID